MSVPTPEHEPPPAYAEAASRSSQHAQCTVFEGSEPRSALVDMLSVSDKNAIRELRGHLPKIFSKAYPSKPVCSAVVLWGVTLDPFQSASANEYIVLYKFLAARKMNVAAAKEMLIATLRWRDEMDISSIMREQFPADVFNPLGSTFGQDKEGRPVSYAVYGNIFDSKAVFGDLKRHYRWGIQFRERVIALLDFENIDQMVQVHDYTGIGDSFNLSDIWAASEQAKTLDAHYPMLVHWFYLVGLPKWMVWGSRLFGAITPSHEYAKTTTVVGTGASTIGKELGKVVDRAQLPAIYGGDGISDSKLSDSRGSAAYPADTKFRD